MKIEIIRLSRALHLGWAAYASPKNVIVIHSDLGSHIRKHHFLLPRGKGISVTVHYEIPTCNVWISPLTEKVWMAWLFFTSNIVIHHIIYHGNNISRWNKPWCHHDDMSLAITYSFRIKPRWHGWKEDLSTDLRHWVHRSQKVHHSHLC